MGQIDIEDPEQIIEGYISGLKMSLAHKENLGGGKRRA
jgi:hypothetical protein